MEETLEEIGVIASLQEFWSHVEEVFTTGFLGQPVGKGVLAIVILVLAFLLRGLIAHVIAASIGKIAGRTKTDFDDKLVEALKKPLAPILRRRRWAHAARSTRSSPK